MDKIFGFIVGRYRLVLLILLIVSIPLGYFFTKPEFLNNLDVFFVKDDPELAFYKEFQKKYGNEEMAVIVFKDGEIFSPRNIGIIRTISERLKETEGVQRVFSLTEAKEAVADKDTVSFVKIIPEGKSGNTDLALIKKRILLNPVVVNSLISKDGSTTAIVIELEPFDNTAKKRSTLQTIMDFSRIAAGDSLKLYFAGVPFVESETNQLSIRDFAMFTPAAFILILFIVAFMLRHVTLSILCQMNLFLTLVWTIGFFTMMGESFNIVTVIMGSIMLAIAVADSIHILAHYRESAVVYENIKDAVLHTIRMTWFPCLFTSLTTAAGFYSFITSSIRPVKILGIYAGTGVIFAYIITMTFLPAMVLLLKIKPEKKTSENDTRLPESDQVSTFMKIIDMINRMNIRNYKIIFSIFILVAALSIAGTFMIKFETNTVNYLPDDNPIKTDIAFIEKNFGGVVPFVMVVKAKTSDYDFTNPESLKLLDAIQTDMMNTISHYSSSFSIVDYIKEINQAFNNGEEKFRVIPSKRADIADYFELGDSEVIERIVSPDRMEARLSFQSKWGSNETAAKYYNYMVKYLDQKIGDNYTYKITGLTSLYLNMEANLKQSQIKSILSSFVMIFIMMFFVCGSFWLTVIVMMPNIFPIVVTLGVMGWFGIPLDVSTIMVASVTIGIAVDNTIHIITWLRRHVAEGNDLKTAIVKSYRDVGKPVIITSVVLFFGFFILVLGTVKPTQAFGMLTAFSMLFGLFGALFMLPAMLLIFKPEIK